MGGQNGNSVVLPLFSKVTILFYIPTSSMRILVSPHFYQHYLPTYRQIIFVYLCPAILLNFFFLVDSLGFPIYTIMSSVNIVLFLLFQTACLLFPFIFLA